MEKLDYTLHPDYKKLESRKSTDHIPEWRKSGEPSEYSYTPTKERPSGKKRPYFTQSKSPSCKQDSKDWNFDRQYPESPETDKNSEMIPLDKNSIMS